MSIYKRWKKIENAKGEFKNFGMFKMEVIDLTSLGLGYSIFTYKQDIHLDYRSRVKGKREAKKLACLLVEQYLHDNNIHHIANRQQFINNNNKGA
jgi:hypothetical protein